MSTKNPKRATLCIGILALNEERRIGRCIASAKFADQIIVVDSGSNDQTMNIASKLGAETYSYTDWRGFAEQRNRLLNHVKTDYIFFLDADEEITPPLEKELVEILSRHEQGAWEVKWLQVAFGRQLKYMSTSGGVTRFFFQKQLKTLRGGCSRACSTPKQYPSQTTAQQAFTLL